jgi:hypothetical protein
MKRFPTTFLLLATCVVLAAGCATGVGEKPLPKAWRPANSIDDTPKVIPLSRPYIYRVMVVDRTLLQLVKRWAKDTQIKDDYKCTDDFTLTTRLVGKSFTTLNQALAEVNDVYRLFGVKVSLNGENKFSVECVNRDVITGIVRLPQSERLGEEDGTARTPAIEPPQTIAK